MHDVDTCKGAACAGVVHVRKGSGCVQLCTAGWICVLLVWGG